MTMKSLITEEQENEYRYSLMARGISAIFLGVIVGALLPAAFHVGISYHFPDEREAQTWGLLLWAEHWAVRVVASLVGTVIAGFLVGLVARQKGGILSAIAAIPTVLSWLAIAIFGWTEQVPFLMETRTVDISIGNKLAASLLVLVTIPAAYWSGIQGEDAGRRFGDFFDSKRGSLLGIKWFHFVWITLFLYLVMVQTSFIALYGFEWMKALWRSDVSYMSLRSIVPAVFTAMVWGTLYILWLGISKAYMVLSGMEDIQSPGARAIVVLKYGFGAFVLSAALQAAISYLHYGLVKLLS